MKQKQTPYFRDSNALRVVVSTSPDPVQVKDPEGRWLESNAAALKVFALEEGQYRGESDLGLAARNSGRREAHLICASSDAQTWNRKTISRFEEVLTAEDGTRTVFDVFKVPLFHPDGSRNQLVVLGRDITAQRNAEEAVRSSELRIRTFLDVAAHELRTPLTPLRLLLEQSLAALAEGKRVERSVIERMQRQTTRLTELANEMIDVARLERSSDPARARPLVQLTDLRALVTPVVEEFRMSSPHRRIELAPGDAAAWIHATPGALERVVATLIDNALKYSGGPLSVKIHVGATEIRLLVRDEGPGISREERAGLFNRFYRVATEATFRQSGLGLGLFISREVISRHGGSIGLDSETGRGSTFYFTLPRQRVD